MHNLVYLLTMASRPVNDSGYSFAQNKSRTFSRPLTRLKNAFESTEIKAKSGGKDVIGVTSAVEVLESVEETCLRSVVEIIGTGGTGRFLPGIVVK